MLVWVQTSDLIGTSIMLGGVRAQKIAREIGIGK